MRLHAVIALLSLLGACRTPAAPPGDLVPAGDQPDVPAVLAEADQGFREYLRVSQMGLIPPEAQRREDVAGALIRWKSKRMLEATAPFEAALTRDAKPEVEEFALLRLSVASLNFGCELAGLEPGGATDAQRGILDDVLTRAAFKSIEEAREWLATGIALGGRRHELLTRLRDALPRDEGAVDQACVATRTAWSSPDSATADDLARAGCEDGEGAMCWIHSRWGSGGADALIRACDADIAPACVELADGRVILGQPQSDPVEAGAAEALYARACGLGDIGACRKEVAVLVPSRADDYRAGCAQDNAVACMKVARTLALAEPERGMWWSCTTSVRPSADEISALCEQGDAFACASRAGALRVDPRYIIRVEAEPAADPAKAALQCSEGDATACASGARAFARAGDWGCAVALMADACGRGDTNLCGFAEVD